MAYNISSDHSVLQSVSVDSLGKPILRLKPHGQIKNPAIHLLNKYSYSSYQGSFTHMNWI